MFTKIKKMVGNIIVTRNGKTYVIAKSSDKRIYAMNLDGNGFFYIDQNRYDADGNYIGNNKRDIVKVYKTIGGHSFGGFDEDIIPANLIFDRED